MNPENKQKVKKNRRGNIKGLSLRNIPRFVHDRMGDYQLKISADRGKFFEIRDAYVEFLKEVVTKETSVTV